MNEFMRNWLTTLVGLIAAVANALVPLVQQGDVSAQTLLQSAGLAALGFVAKAFNVSGTKSE